MAVYSVSYDLKETNPKPHKQFALAAEKEGLLYVCLVEESLYRLPNTTLWGTFASKDAVRDAFERALRAAEQKLNIKIALEKRLISRLSDWYIRSDKTKAPEAKWTGKTAIETCLNHQVHDPFFAY